MSKKKFMNRKIRISIITHIRLSEKISRKKAIKHIANFPVDKKVAIKKLARKTSEVFITKSAFPLGISFSNSS